MPESIRTEGALLGMPLAANGVVWRFSLWRSGCRRYSPTVRKEDIDEFAAQRPFRPFEVHLVDGKRYRFSKIEQFLVGRTTLAALDRKGHLRLISLGLITEVGPARPSGRRRPRT